MNITQFREFVKEYEARQSVAITLAEIQMMGQGLNDAVGTNPSVTFTEELAIVKFEWDHFGDPEHYGRPRIRWVRVPLEQCFAKSEQAPPVVTRPDGCTCQLIDEDEELHPCPFAEDIHDDPSDFCTCCDHCTQQCAMDI